MPDEISNVFPTAISLDSVNIVYIGSNPDRYYLKCGSCGKVYDVEKDKVTLPNWYACPSPKHRHHGLDGSSD